MIILRHLWKIIDLCGSICKEMKNNSIKTENLFLEKNMWPLLLEWCGLCLFAFPVQIYVLMWENWLKPQ